MSNALLPHGTITCPVVGHYGGRRVSESFLGAGFGSGNLPGLIAPWARFLDGGQFWFPHGPTRRRQRDGTGDGWDWSESGLEAARSTSRLLYQLNDFAGGFVDCLVEYTLGSGLGWKGCRRKTLRQTATPTGRADDLPADVVALQIAFDIFRDEQKWWSRQQELGRRFWRDGEYFLWLGRGGRGQLPLSRIFEPEEVRCPSGLEADPRCTYGVLTAANDGQRVLGYWVSRQDGTGRAVRAAGADRGLFLGMCEDYRFPVGRGVVVHLKHGVDSTVKRGLPLLFSGREMLEAARVLLRNVLETAKEQASIALIATHAEATLEGTYELIQRATSAASTRVPMPQPGGGVVYTPALTNWGGAVRKDVDEHTTYAAGPVSTGTELFLAAEAAALQSAAARKRVPYHFISSNAEAANYASIVEAKSPFVVARQSDQRVFADAERDIAREVVRLSCESGAVDGDPARLDAEIDMPPIAVKSEKEQEEIQSIRQRDKIISPQQRIKQTGGDPAHVVADLKAWAKEFPEKQTGGDDPEGGDGDPDDFDPTKPDKGTPPSAVRDPGAGVTDVRRVGRATESKDALGHGSEKRDGGWVREDFDPDKHPRGDKGQFVPAGAIKAAARDPEAAAELRAKVTRPEEREKLDSAIKAAKDDRSRRVADRKSQRRADRLSLAKDQRRLSRVTAHAGAEKHVDELASSLPAGSPQLAAVAAAAPHYLTAAKAKTRKQMAKAVVDTAREADKAAKKAGAAAVKLHADRFKSGILPELATAYRLDKDSQKEIASGVRDGLKEAYRDAAAETLGEARDVAAGVREGDDRETTLAGLRDAVLKPHSDPTDLADKVAEHLGHPEDKDLSNSPIWSGLEYTGWPGGPEANEGEPPGPLYEHYKSVGLDVPPPLEGEDADDAYDYADRDDVSAAIDAGRERITRGALTRLWSQLGLDADAHSDRIASEDILVARIQKQRPAVYDHPAVKDLEAAGINLDSLNRDFLVRVARGRPGSRELADKLIASARGGS